MRRTLTERWSYTSHVFPFAPNGLLRYLCSWNVSRDTNWSHLVVKMTLAGRTCFQAALGNRAILFAFCNATLGIAVTILVNNVRSWPFDALSLVRRCCLSTDKFMGRVCVPVKKRISI